MIFYLIFNVLLKIDPSTFKNLEEIQKTWKKFRKPGRNLENVEEIQKTWKKFRKRGRNSENVEEISPKPAATLYNIFSAKYELYNVYLKQQCIVQKAVNCSNATHTTVVTQQSHSGIMT